MRNFHGCLYRRCLMMVGATDTKQLHMAAGITLSTYYIFVISYGGNCLLYPARLLLVMKRSCYWLLSLYLTSRRVFRLMLRDFIEMKIGFKGALPSNLPRPPPFFFLSPSIADMCSICHTGGIDVKAIRGCQSAYILDRRGKNTQGFQEQSTNRSLTFDIMAESYLPS